MNNYLKKIITFVFSIITFLAFSYFLNIKQYGLYSVLIFIMIFSLYSNFKLCEKFNFKNKTYLYGFIFCFVLAFLYFLGYSVISTSYSIDSSAFRVMFKFSSIVGVIGFCLLFYCFYSNYINKLVFYIIPKRERELSNKKIFAISFVFIVICWLPYFLTLFPGVLTNDSMTQFSSFINGFNITSDHHPVMHTVFMGIVYNIGDIFFNNPNNITAFVSFTQMLLMSFIFSYFILFLNSLKINYKVILITLLYFALSPIHAYYSVTMWKDVLFGGFLLLFIIYLIKIDIYNFNYKMMIKFILISLLVLLFRNNAIYMYLFIIPFTILHYKKERFKMIICIFLSLFIFFIVKTAVFNYYNISSSSSSEYISIPMQQIGRMAYKGVEFNSYEKKMINDIIDIDILADVYNPTICDNIKFNSNYDISAFNNNKFDYFKMWFNLVLKHPSIALEAYLNSTLGYWYSDVDYWATADFVQENNFGIYHDSKIDGIFSNYVYGITSRNIPIISFQWSIGLCLTILFSMAFILFLKKRIMDIYYFLPIFGIWLTMMVAAPVFAEFRYVYSAFTCLPLLIIIPFVRLKTTDNKVI